MNDLQMILAFARIETLRSVGLITPEDTIKYSKEYEFTINKGVITHLEVWTNSARTQGYRKIKVSKQISDTYSKLITSFTNQYK